MNEHEAHLLEYINKIYHDLEIIKMGIDYKKWRDYRLVLGTIDPNHTFDYPILKSNISSLETIKTETTQNELSNVQKEKMPIEDLLDEEIKVWLDKVMPFALECILQWEHKISLVDVYYIILKINIMDYINNIYNIIILCIDPIYYSSFMVCLIAIVS